VAYSVRAALARGCDRETGVEEVLDAEVGDLPAGQRDQHRAGAGCSPVSSNSTTDPVERLHIRWEPDDPGASSVATSEQPPCVPGELFRGRNDKGAARSVRFPRGEVHAVVAIFPFQRWQVRDVDADGTPIRRVYLVVLAVPLVLLAASWAVNGVDDPFGRVAASGIDAPGHGALKVLSD
jgi:hypothetical protein